MSSKSPYLVWQNVARESHQSTQPKSMTVKVTEDYHFTWRPATCCSSCLCAASAASIQPCRNFLLMCLLPPLLLKVEPAALWSGGLLCRWVPFRRASWDKLTELCR